MNQRSAQIRSSSCHDLTIVIPVYNEEKLIQPLVCNLVASLQTVVLDWRILFVNDGSTDLTFEQILSAHHDEPRIGCISLSRNFGKEIALRAGLDVTNSDSVIFMDADLQHPPELIPKFLAKSREGYDVVYGERQNWHNENQVHRFLAGCFYTVFGSLSGTHLPRGAGDFRLMNRKAVDALRAIPERQRFTKGLYSWIGFKSTGVPFVVEPRLNGVSRFNFKKLFYFALDGIVSFSIVPLRLASFVGFMISTIALAFGLYSIIEKYTTGVPVPGYATLVVLLTFLSGVQLLFLGVIGEYIGRIYTEVKQKPLYFIQTSIGIET